MNIMKKLSINYCPIIFFLLLAGAHFAAFHLPGGCLQGKPAQTRRHEQHFQSAFEPGDARAMAA